MNDKEQQKAAKNFSSEWNGHGDEKSDTQNFWTTLLKNIFEIEKPFDFIKFNQSVNFFSENGKRHTGEFDAVISTTKVLIEQKSFDKNLDSKYLQSDGAILTPFEQAKRYAKGYNEGKNLSDKIKWIVTCNFSTFRIYDVRYSDDFFYTLFPEFRLVKSIPLRRLYEEIDALKFLVDPNDDTHKYEVKISNTAAKIIDKLRETFRKDYSPQQKEFLNKMCVRLVFLYYANDAKLISDNRLKTYLDAHKYSRETLQNLFNVLKLPENLRENNIDADLKNFPYVNGGLFDEDIFIPNFRPSVDFEIRNAINEGLRSDKIKKFAWKFINPTIFGAMFENILSDDQRRAGGMHYTSVENIHKVIDPLFLDELNTEFISAKRAHKNKNQRLFALQNKMADMIFFDPACGSGNFLTETFLSLRELENKIIEELHTNNISLFKNPIKVSINQFFGIEINNFAVQVAQVALWISENQMFQRTEGIVGSISSGLPLNKYNQIINTNALQVDWNTILQKDKFAGKQIFIIGNPPFIGGMMMTRKQKAEMIEVWGNIKGVGEMDYVSAWYRKAFTFIKGTKIEAAFVSTNSITQGQQALTMWKPLVTEGLKINFAHRTFKWTSDSEKMAAVHCVIIGFADFDRKKKFIYNADEKTPINQINSYLLDVAQTFIDYRSNPICNVPAMHFGSMPRDGGNFIIDDYDNFIKNEPSAKKYIHPYIGAEEFINGKKRYCLWLVGVSLDEIKKMPLVAERVEKVKNFRLASKAASTRKFAETPHLFCQIAQPDTDYILIPGVSSENRRYIPMGFMSANVIASNLVHIIPDATIYHFGILISSVHMAWTRAVCGRLESRYRYSKDIVYNNFVWCNSTAKQRAEIERTAQKILDVLENFKTYTLAQLYDEKTMPAELRAAHLANDKAVMAAYGFNENLTESEIVAELFKMYSDLTKNPPPSGKDTMTNNFFSLESTAQEILETVRRSKYYYFGVLTSSVHMAWTRAVCGRLKSDYRYSKDIVYNNFVWCKPTAEQAAAICETAEKILQVRAGHAGKTSAYLYGAEMPEDLKAAHRANDLAVLAAYGFGESWSDSEIVAELFKMYRQLSKS